MKNTLFGVIMMALLLFSCGKKENNQPECEGTLSGLKCTDFDKEIDGKSNKLYVMKNNHGMEVCVINFGARIVSVMVPDRDGKMTDVVLGFKDIDGFTSNKSDFGAAIGRYGNRIGGGKFTIDGTEYQLPQNDGENTLHGGPTGFQYKMFDIKQIDAQTLECSFISPDGDNNFPGNLNVKITYRLTEDNAIDIAYSATTDKPTVINLTNHSYFNLSGNPTNPITDHILFLDCGQYTPTNEQLIPTGVVASVEGTPMDFTTPTVIGDRINDYTFEALKFGNGYDHNWIFNHPGNLENVACRAICPSTGIALEVHTSEPAVQFYAGNFLDGSQTGKNGIVYQQRTGFCLETQHYPDSPNKPDFPSTVLRPGEEYTSRCIYRFCID